MAIEWIDGVTKMFSSVVNKIYYFGNLCVTLGVFLIVVAVARERYEFVVIATRLILGGFSLAFCQNSTWRDLRRYLGVLFLVLAFVPTRYYAVAFNYLK